MVTKTQFNPSTLKVLFNAATQKVQMAVAGSGNECWHCPGTTPLIVSVSFYNVTALVGCQWIGPDIYENWYKASFSTENPFNDVSHSLNLVEFYPYDCGWDGKISEGFHIEQWRAELNGGYTCVEMIKQADLDILIELRRGATQATLTVRFGAEGWPQGAIFMSGLYSPTSGKCVEKSSVLNSATWWATGGEATITEII
jgi:hypothetical protein